MSSRECTWNTFRSTSGRQILKPRCSLTLAAWLAELERASAQTAARGGPMLCSLQIVACAQWLSFAPVDPTTESTMGWFCMNVAKSHCDAIADYVGAYGISILAGTIPFAAGLSRKGRQHNLNRAMFTDARKAPAPRAG